MPPPASSDRITRLQAIRDNLEKELEDETARRLALAEAGNPPPTSYSISGKSVSWNDYLKTMMGLIKDAQDQLVAAGGDGGLYEEHMRGYS